MTLKIEPGTIVKVNTGELGVRRGSPAILLKMDRGFVRLLTDAGIVHTVRRQITVPRTPLPPFEPMRLRLAYGIWTEKDGSRVLFSRDYCPQWRIAPDGCVSPEDPWRWIESVNQNHFWDDSLTPWRSRQKQREIEQRMAQMGVTGTPKLMDVVDILVRDEAEDIHGAVRILAPPGIKSLHHLQLLSGTFSARSQNI